VTGDGDLTNGCFADLTSANVSKGEGIMRKGFAAFLALGMCASLSFAGGIDVGPSGPLEEVEPNDSFGGAQILPGDFFDLYGAGAVEGFLGEGDVDFYKVSLPADVLVTASVFDFTPEEGFDNDSLLGVFSPDGLLFDEDDDDGPGFLSSIHFFPDVAGVWAFAVTGFGDDDYNGDGHDEMFDYRLVLSIPEPASFGLLLVGAAFVLGRKRN
jgi:hypothetical protein